MLSGPRGARPFREFRLRDRGRMDFTTLARAADQGLGKLLALCSPGAAGTGRHIPETFM
jgi:hypothetical protein